MMNLLRLFHPAPSLGNGPARLHTDGAIWTENKPGQPGMGQALTGLAAIARDADGRICHWWKRQAGPMTNNEAEYAAAILGLEELHTLGVREVEVYTDSQVMVDQMQGLARVNAPNLRMPHAQLRALVASFRRVKFYHIPREHNQLADALANEALEGLPWQAFEASLATAGLAKQSLPTARRADVPTGRFPERQRPASQAEGQEREGGLGNHWPDRQDDRRPDRQDDRQPNRKNDGQPGRRRDRQPDQRTGRQSGRQGDEPASGQNSRRADHRSYRWDGRSNDSQPDHKPSGTPARRSPANSTKRTIED